MPVCAGVMAAFGGLCMKIGINNVNSILKHFGADVDHKGVFLWIMYFVVMIGFIVAGVCFNIGNLKYYVIALKYIGASLTVAISFIVNYLWSVILNWAVFHKVPTFGQYIGSGMFLLGLYFISFQNCFSKTKTDIIEDASFENPDQNNIPQALDNIDEKSVDSNPDKIQNFNINAEQDNIVPNKIESSEKI